MRRRAFVAGMGCGVAGLLGGCVTGTPLSPDVRETETRTIGVDGVAELAVDNRQGSVEIEGYDGDVLSVEITKQGRTQEALDAASLRADESGDTLVLATEYDDATGDETTDEAATDETADGRRASVSLSIQCPDGVSVGAVETANGSVDVRNVSGDVVLESENGSVSARGVDGPVALRTRNGSVTARDVGVLREARTRNANVDVEVPALDGDADVHTANGDVDATLAPDLDAKVTAETTNGYIDVEGIEFASARSRSGRISGTLGDGTHDLSIRTSNGDVELTALPG